MTAPVVTTEVEAWSEEIGQVVTVTVDAALLAQFRCAVREWLDARPPVPEGLPAHIRLDHLVSDPVDAARMTRADADRRAL